MDVSDQESMESSSSDEGSENEMADSRASLKQNSFGSPEEQRPGSSGAWEGTLGSDGEESDDGEMASAVASASQQANKFLEDSDSEEEKMEEPR